MTSLMFLSALVLFLSSCGKEKIDEVSPVATVDNNKTLEDYPNEITIDNWREFVYAPQSVIDHFAAKEVNVTTVPARDLQIDDAENRAMFIVGFVQAFNGAWNPIPDVRTTIGSFVTDSQVAAPNNYYNFDNGVDDLCMEYSTMYVPTATPLNGVTTFDLVVIQRHILSIQCFTEAREFLAADATRDGVIDSLDINDIQDVILFIEPDFVSSPSYVFVTENDYNNLQGMISGCTAPNATLLQSYGLTNPCLPPVAMQTLNRFMIKTGDLNGSFSF